jgi:hypothetical protein
MNHSSQQGSFSRIFATLYLLCGVVALYFLSDWSVSTVLIDPDDSAPWKRTVNLRNNSYHLWQWDPFSSFLSDALSSISAWCQLPPVSPSLVQAIILFLGTILVTLAIRPNRGAVHPAIGLLACLPVFLVVACIGWDPVVLGIIAWIPILSIVTTTLILIVRRNQAFVAGPVWIIGGFISLQHALAANQMAIFSGAVAITLAYVLATEDSSSVATAQEPAKENPTPQTTWRSPLLYVALLIMVPACVATLIRAPHAPLPDYPTLAHVVPDDGLKGVISPLIGREYPLHIIDRSALKSELFIPALIVCVTLFLAWLLQRKQLRIKGTLTVSLALALGAIVLLDLALPERYAALAPLMSLSRLTPWGATMSTTVIAFGLAAWLLGTFLLSIPNKKTKSILFTAALCCCGYGEWTQREVRQAEYEYLSNPALRSAAISPSAAPLRHHLRATDAAPSSVLSDISLISNAAWEDVRKFGAVFNTSPGATNSRIQRKPDTPPEPPLEFPNPSGVEFLSLSLPKATTARGIDLDLGKRTSDFPRGLSITTGTCEAPETPLANYPDWQGALALSPDGYPYFLGQSEVRIVFARDVTFSALCIRQTNKSELEWYVKSVRLMKPSPASNDQEPR